jgi:hypothetical protein
MKTGDRVKIRDRKYPLPELNRYRGMGAVVLEVYPDGAAVMTDDGALLLRFENIIEELEVISKNNTLEEL